MKPVNLALTALAALAAGGAKALAADPAAPTRVPLAVIPLESAKTVARVETTRVDFAPGQAMPAHRHTVPVICFVTEGAFLTRIGDGPERSAPMGSVTFEPPGVLIRYFKNASSTEPAQLECASLAGADDHVLNVPAAP